MGFEAKAPKNLGFTNPMGPMWAAEWYMGSRTSDESWTGPTKTHEVGDSVLTDVEALNG